MQLSDYQLCFIPKWIIIDHPDYYFCVDKKLHNLKTKRVIKKVVKGGYSVGYSIDGVFMTIKKLKELTVRFKSHEVEKSYSDFLLKL